MDQGNTTGKNVQLSQKSAAETGKATKGFSAEEKAAMRQRLKELTPAEEIRIVALVKKAVSG